MAIPLKGLVAGMLIGIAGVLLVGHIADRNQGVPEQLAEALGCSTGSSGLRPSSARDAQRYFGRDDGFSRFAATNAERILDISGCDPLGPATTYLEFGPRTNMNRVLKTLDNFGAVCVVGQAVFEGKVLDGRVHFEELCDTVGGELKVLSPSKPTRHD
ncbi:MAG TPA: hypothetical protein VFY04_08525 [Solirubrobacterales bacterium]|nr:hypothetical protein [Solirubrobacterales bacterium]